MLICSQQDGPRTLSKTFLQLARELRQNILIRSYTFENDISSWTFTEEKAKVDKLVAALEASVGPTLGQILLDIDYAKTQWFAELRETREAVEAAGAPHCTNLKDEEALRKVTREGQAPWVRILHKLYLMNRKWWWETSAETTWNDKKEEIRKSHGNYDYEGFGCIIDVHVHPPWDNHGRCRNVLFATFPLVDAWVGPSGVEWCGPSYGSSGHPPSTWESAGQVSLSEAAERDLAWLQRQAEAYFN